MKSIQSMKKLLPVLLALLMLAGCASPYMEIQKAPTQDGHFTAGQFGYPLANYGQFLEVTDAIRESTYMMIFSTDFVNNDYAYAFFPEDDKVVAALYVIGEKDWEKASERFDEATSKVLCEKDGQRFVITTKIATDKEFAQTDAAVVEALKKDFLSGTALTELPG